MFFSGFADEAGNDLETQIRATREIGWNHIEMRNVNGTTPAYADDDEFDRIHARIEEEGIRISCFGSRIANGQRDITEEFERDVDELKRSIPRMRKMGAPIIRIMSWTNKTGVPETEWRDEGLRRIKELAKIAEDGGVLMGHENCSGWFGLGPKNALELIEAVNSPALKLIYDTGNAFSHGVDGWEFYSQIKPHIAYVHIKDERAGDERSLRTWPGEGECRVKEIVADLLKSGYDGCISIEPHLAGQDPDPEKNRYGIYVEYGKRMTALVASARG